MKTMEGCAAPSLPMATCQRIGETLALAICDLRIALARGGLSAADRKEATHGIEGLENLFDGDAPSRTPACGHCPGCGSSRSTATLQ
jgi:hypothetical protein